jgi:hypothetical protein
MPRGSHFDHNHQSQAARQWTRDPRFHEHNEVIAPDGPAAVSAYMRSAKGSALLDAWHVEFLFLENMTRGVEGGGLPETDRRLLYGWYVWRAIWGGLNATPKPTADEFLQEKDRVKAIVGSGMPLSHPLDVVYIAPDDFADQRGVSLSRKKQRKAFRTAMEQARVAAKAWSDEIAQQRHAEQSTPRKPGQRRPSTSTPVFVSNRRTSQKYQHRHRIT